MAGIELIGRIGEGSMFEGFFAEHDRRKPNTTEKTHRVLRPTEAIRA